MHSAFCISGPFIGFGHSYSFFLVHCFPVLVKYCLVPQLLVLCQVFLLHIHVYHDSISLFKSTHLSFYLATRISYLPHDLFSKLSLHISNSLTQYKIR
ncbi:uncharacterized protein BO80DRAFT_29388 [Aspergillus ibericus CBS 121593]|uniref:Uncharacterized protein n=1 Tax=Aspergillus ibericus CBS 121593 TaxID=1448316 RepID=A0A395H4W0_9EURO|nr:hypothetical protein BO80DRAFT_29388 [Aspergillus ibericus CBS 121593]RAL02710.1 hypothetical protein BO80DRAFT_29388 [Aspergillus ibericus CBS 121593]